MHPYVNAPGGSDRGTVADLMGRLRSGLAAYAADRPWSAAERPLVGPMLLREALRRLATVLAAAEEFGTPLAVDSVRSRHAALVCVLDLLAYDASILA
ncbi:hypothetical protein [Actinopolymorpha pittospori]|uniref:hypothetical protein n=1 Tax=Actinopolymorpha pittospori TaxID=648752 RepID=UPI00178A9C24|nr:hypothetical protein [Actinopolymorpha pittospori]